MTETIRTNEKAANMMQRIPLKRWADGLGHRCGSKRRKRAFTRCSDASSALSDQQPTVTCLLPRNIDLVTTTLARRFRWQRQVHHYERSAQRICVQEHHGDRFECQQRH